MKQPVFPWILISPLFHFTKVINKDTYWVLINTEVVCVYLLLRKTHVQIQTQKIYFNFQLKRFGLISKLQPVLRCCKLASYALNLEQQQKTPLSVVYWEPLSSIRYACHFTISSQNSSLYKVLWSGGCTNKKIKATISGLHRVNLTCSSRNFFSMCA